MSSMALIQVHASQFPERVRAELKECLARREIHPKFHYDSIDQVRKWMAVHQAFSPFCREASCRSIYDRAAEKAAEHLPEGDIQVAGLGCGSGAKDRLVLSALAARGRKVEYVPVDVGTPMVLVARNHILQLLPAATCRPLVCDLARVEDFAGVLEEAAPFNGPRVVTFYGMLPNFLPDAACRLISKLLRGNALLLMSANLAPGAEYAAGVQSVLPLYDNPPTRRWLMTFLTGLGIGEDAGTIDVTTEECPHGSGLRRVAASFRFVRDTIIHIDADEFRFAAGETILLLFSYRHSVQAIGGMLADCGGRVVDQWISDHGDEGVFLCVAGRGCA